MLELLRELRRHVVIGFVGGSDLVKIQEQLGADGTNGLFTLLEPIASRIYPHVLSQSLIILTLHLLKMALLPTSWGNSFHHNHSLDS